MSEIKFACPHCGQHIACERDLASLDIECPSCGGNMVVPRLTSAASQHPDALIVASTPSTKLTHTGRVSTLDPWTKEKWRQHCDELSGAAPHGSPPWLIAALCTLIIAAILRANNVSIWFIISGLLMGGIVSGILAAKTGGGNESAGPQLLKALAYVCIGIIILPVVALGILFVGCTACR